MVKKWKNFAEDTLASGLSSSQLSLQPTTPSKFPLVSGGDYFTVAVENEIIQVTNSTSVPWTVVRGYDGTSQVPHSATTPLNLVIINEDMVAFQSGPVLLPRIDSGGASDGQVLAFSAALGHYVPSTIGSGGGTDVDSLATAVDVALISPATGDLLTYDAATGKWTNQPLGSLSDTDSLSTLSDVLIASPIDNQILIYHAATGQWENRALPRRSLASDTDVSLLSTADAEVLTFNSLSGKWQNQKIPKQGYLGGELDVTGLLKLESNGWSGIMNSLSPAIWYRLDEASGTVAADSSGHGRTGTYTANVAYGKTSMVGDTDKAITATGAAALSWTGSGTPTGTNPVTIGVWFRTTATPVWSELIYYGAIPDTGPGSLIRLLLLDANTVRLGFDGPGVNHQAPSAINDGQPHLLVGTYDGNYGTLYLDGVRLGSVTLGALVLPGGTIRIGTTGDTGTDISCDLDEAFLLAQAIGDGEVAALWAAGHQSGNLIEGYDGATETFEVQADGTVSKAKVPLARLTQSGAVNGQTPVWSDTDTAWVPGTPSSSASTHYEPLTNGDPSSPDLLYLSGDVIMVIVPN